MLAWTPRVVCRHHVSEEQIALSLWCAILNEYGLECCVIQFLSPTPLSVIRYFRTVWPSFAAAALLNPETLDFMLTRSAEQDARICLSPHCDGLVSPGYVSECRLLLPVSPVVCTLWWFGISRIPVWMSVPSHAVLTCGWKVETVNCLHSSYHGNMWPWKWLGIDHLWLVCTLAGAVMPGFNLSQLVLVHYQQDFGLNVSNCFRTSCHWLLCKNCIQLQSFYCGNPCVKTTQRLKYKWSDQGMVITRSGFDWHGKNECKGFRKTILAHWKHWGKRYPWELRKCSTFTWIQERLLRPMITPSFDTLSRQLCSGVVHDIM